MAARTSRFRLQSSAFDRPEENMQIEPKRAIVLSVEGDETEQNYFKHLKNYIASSENNMIIHVEVLRHKHGDGYSSPEHVVEFLNEYINVRNGELIPELVEEDFRKKYSPDTVAKYLENPNSISRTEQNALSDELLKLGIDLEYRRYLQTFNTENDFFAVVLDRDCGSHSYELMKDCIRICNENSYGCYISNPCFEFWLLLHLCDVKTEYSNAFDLLLENKKVSNSHTYVSKEVSLRAHHNKHISNETFYSKYLHHIPLAIERSKDFALGLDDILDHVGSNLSELFIDLGFAEIIMNKA